MNVIAVRDLSKRYATRDGSVVALEGISFGIGDHFDPEKIAAEARAYRPGG